MNATELMAKVVFPSKEPDALLVRKRDTLAQYRDISDIGIAADNGDREAKALDWAVREVRNSFLRALIAREVFVGTEVIESLLFEALIDSSVVDPIAEVANGLTAFVALGHGVAVFPLTSVGFPATGFAATPEAVSLNLDDYGVRIYPQANTDEAALRNIEEARQALGVSQPLPLRSFQHWRASRPTDWLICNPLMFVRFHQIPAGYYDNQFALVLIAHFATSLVYGLAALAGRDPREDLFNSRTANNHETHDFKHYLTLYPRSAAELAGDCVPLLRTNTRVLEVTDLNVYLPSDHTAHVDVREWQRFADALGENRRALFESVVGGTRQTRDSPSGRFAEKLMESLRFFRRSHSTIGYSAEHVVSLASAFETLLTDNYSRGVGMTLRERTEACLVQLGRPDATALADGVESLYKARCSVLHAGEGAEGHGLDLGQLKRTYVLCYSLIAAGVSALPSPCPAPVAAVLGMSPPSSLSRSPGARLTQFGIGVLRDIRRRVRMLRES